VFNECYDGIVLHPWAFREGIDSHGSIQEQERRNSWRVGAICTKSTDSFGPTYEAGTDASDGFPIPISPFLVVRPMVIASVSRLPDASLDSASLRCEAATDTRHRVKM